MEKLPVDWEHMPEPQYQNEDVQCEYVKVEALNDGAPQKDIVAASKRGRSHAQEAKPRDDHFKMAHLEMAGILWLLLMELVLPNILVRVLE